MNLCIDIGNTRISFGVFRDNDLIECFSYPTSPNITSDQLGIFIINYLEALKINKIEQISIASVVPALDKEMVRCSVHYLKVTPIFLTHSTQNRIKICNSNPQEVGADRIANAISATRMFAGEDLFIVDFGTATTVCYISMRKHYYGCAIIPGFEMGAKALHDYTAKLPLSTMNDFELCLGGSTMNSIQLGLFYGQLGAIKEIIFTFKERLSTAEARTIVTGGYTKLYKKYFDLAISDMTLKGLNYFLQ